MPDSGRVHRFRDHAVAGVNWRATKFVDEVPSSRVCALCRMIPKRTVLLPCSHALCQPCHVASCQGASGRCPLDQKPFDGAECVTYDLPAKKAAAMKVRCWNEAHGCQFEGAVEDMLGHFEEDCAFQPVECLRCGEAVLHSDLPSHYVAGCSASVPPAGTVNPSPESTALLLQEVCATLEQLKALVKYANQEHILPVVQSQMNELAEQVRNQERRLAEMTREVGASVAQIVHEVGVSEGNIKAEIVQAAATISSTTSEDLPSRRNTPVESNTSSSSYSEMAVTTTRRVDYFTNLPPVVLANMRKASSSDYPQLMAEHIQCVRLYNSATGICCERRTDPAEVTTVAKDGDANTVPEAPLLPTPPGRSPAVW
ncbi:hypothetical protein HPB51_027059 [Rhipicephalus microplus]|uniref:RING-type domain-containing protein n=1 Tax=Rhipicephalus microplus TaxID=6941 RepID=A0A9J6D1H4_RHIMP|nr:hypothetical protein HPB51_027059 [Rhipicephalus microplus]